MRRLSMLVTLAAALVLIPSAGGAMGVRVAVEPASPRVLTRATVQIRPFYPLIRNDGSCCRLESGDPVGYPFRVRAFSPRGKVLRVTVKRSRAGLWEGVVRFPTAGRWEVRVMNYPASDRRARRWVRVRSQGA